jgi:heat shock protein HspQ
VETLVDIVNARFSVGEVVHHQLFNYRGVIVDVDPEFQAPEEWYEAVAKSRPPKDQPWYHVLVDGAGHATYVAERNLEHDQNTNPVNHPLIKEFFSSFENGRYIRDDWAN